MKKLGIQLYSAEDALNRDFRGAVKAMAEMGYTSVEGAIYDNVTVDEFASSVKDAGLSVSGIHCDLSRLDNEFDKTIAYFNTLDCHDFIIPWSTWEDEDYINMANGINKYQPILKKEGIDLHFHNHQYEFLDRIARGPHKCIPFEHLRRETDVLFQIDMYWVAVAGKDPLKVIAENKDRIKFVHMKDGLLGSEGGEAKVLGCGQAPVIAVRDLALELGIEMIVENECREPDGLTAAAECYKFLTK